MTYDPKYKMKYRPPRITRLLKYDHVPPPMADDPPPPRGCWQDWNERCRVVYAHMLAMKKGVVPPSNRRGLWFHAERTPM